MALRLHNPPRIEPSNCSMKRDVERIAECGPLVIVVSPPGMTN
jgi:hypothetical protein